MSKITVNFSKIVRKMKPMHSINNAPLSGCDDRLFYFLAEAGIPYSRLHDTGGRYGGFCYVDIENIFRDFNADPFDPAAYDFAFTDWLLAALNKNGVRPFYRLGATIENYHYIKAYHIFPPKDNLKWAQICEGIIKHYNEGWGNGYHYDIKYWEIWNEPDNEPITADNPMWKGDKQQYFALYEITANYLKKQFPHLKIGGYASCGFYAILNKTSDVNANVSPRTEYFLEFFTEFLQYISSEEHKSPLDFFSWHSYSGITENIEYAEYARSTLDKYGFVNAESILNEWNPSIGNRGKLKDAANISAMMCAMQKTSLDQLMYYDGQADTPYGGIWNPLTMSPFKAYYSFKSFNELYILKNEAESSTDDGDIYVCAATDYVNKAVLAVNTADCDKTIRFFISDTAQTVKQAYIVYILDETHDLEKVSQINTDTAIDSPEIHVPANSVILIKTNHE